ncbi:hypothetical protein [Sphingomonas sp. CROZ-RG-20F-R02-07]|uniref:hypothetical protein n=1 Tax=Sphingomonas sp. CROZ-RG-20F-R02-07 TaxID=2914832 RepID=UPI001F57C917|nr:hypothetical protein [Sphingomonas sp. CROZ-RG-20F-R02-07]
MHLPAVVPNEGARLLAAWMVAQPVGTYRRFVQRVGGVIMADRLIAGEVRPGLDLAFSIYAFTSSAVMIASWGRPAKGWWFDIAPETGKLAA